MYFKRILSIEARVSVFLPYTLQYLQQKHQPKY